jgi:parvulin-like peptidyl-prolyl isomerase
MAKRRRIPTPTWDHQPGTLGRRLEANSWQLLGLGAIILLIVAALGLIGWGYLSDYIEDRNRPGSTAIEVEGREYSVRDYTRRARLYVEERGGNNQYFLVIPSLNNELTEEAVLLEYGAEELGTDATEEEINGQIATILGITVDDANFEARFQEELTASGLSEQQYRDMAHADVLKQKLTEKYKSEVPATLPSAHYRQIQVEDQATADQLVDELNNGADFGALYVEHSVGVAEGDETGGDKGFVPEGLLEEAQEGVLFALEPGEITTYPTGNAVLIWELLEKSDTQEVTDDQKNRLAANRYSEWYDGKKESVDIKNDLDLSSGEYDLKKVEYIIDNVPLVTQ